MENTHWQRVKEIFQEARERRVADRSEFITRACGGDQQIRAEVEALLAAEDEAGDFLASPTMNDTSEAASAGATEILVLLQRAVSGRFSIERELGRGGMGIVFLARDVALDRPVAIKLLPPALASNPEHRARFLREARTAAGLSHPNIVPIHLVEEKDGLVYLVMALIDGESLGERVRRAGPLKPGEAARIVQEVAWALAYAHGRGVIHRDIKPDNILIDNATGRALVADFGIARVTGSATTSQQIETFGTLQYMSPEQASGASEIDGRADLYSLGVTAFFALTGRLPFEAAHPIALITMHVGTPAPPLRSVNRTVPARLAEVVDRCLAKDPGTRFESGEALAVAITEAQVMRRDIAPSVREFLGAAKSGAAQVTGVALVWFAVYEAIPRVMPSGPMLGHPLDPVFAILTMMTGIILIRPILAARGVLRAGLDHHAVAEAAAAAVTARDANIEYELARIDRLGRLLSTIWARAVFFSLGSLLLWAITVGAVLPALRDPARLGSLALPLFSGACAAFLVALAIVPKRIVAAFTRGTPENGALMRKLWAGPIARWFFKIAGIGLGRREARSIAESAPTELLLGRAASELFEQLPEAQRDRLGDVREVIRGLEHAAVALRARRAELDGALADAGAPDGSARRPRLVNEIEEIRHAVDERLRTAVSALENLRLDLLRLRTGVGHSGDLTVAIEQARAVGAAVEVEMAAHQEVESLVAHVR